MRLRRQAALAMGLGLMVAMLAAQAAQSRPERAPQRVLGALPAAKVGASALPHGYRSPQVAAYTVTAAAKAHHAVGGAQIVADGGNEAIIYIVFRTKADAKADFAHANLAGKATSSAPGSVPKPSIVVNTSATGTLGGKNVTIGITDVAFVQGNVLVQAATTSTSSKEHGDVAGAFALAQFASKHLKSVG
jgi:hypothetical protein